VSAPDAMTYVERHDDVVISIGSDSVVGGSAAAQLLLAQWANVTTSVAHFSGENLHVGDTN
jgi:hypothetical protein